MNQLIYQKTQEISFALLRVAAYIRRFGLRKKIEDLSYNLLENITYRNHQLALHTIDAIQGFIDLGKNMYEIEVRNHEILTRELLILTKEVQELSGEFPLRELDDLFTKIENIRPGENKENGKYGNNTAIGNAKLPYLPNKTTPKTSNGGNETRKKEILAFIESAKDHRLQLKSITEKFSEISDRTLRYDLTSLINDGELERAGGGPLSFYVRVNKGIQS